MILSVHGSKSRIRSIFRRFLVDIFRICAMLCVLHCIQNVTADVGSERSSYVSVLTPFQMESLIGTVERIITSFDPWTQVIIFFKSMTSYNQEGGTCGGNGTVREVRYMTQLSDKYI